MDVTAKYELIGLMAYPIRHSLSPEMQNKALEKAGLPFTYMAFEVDNDSFPGCIDSQEVRKKPGGHWIIRDLTGLDLMGLASL